MGEAVDRPVIWGQTHRYQLGPALGERTFWALDEQGRPWTIEIGRIEVMRGREAIQRSLAEGVLPRIREHGDMPGGRLGYVVCEWLCGYTLGDLVIEGRRLSPPEMRRLGYDLAQAAQAFLLQGAEVRTLRPADILYCTQDRHWRVLSPGEWRATAEAAVDLGWIGRAMLAGGGSVPGEEPPWLHEDQRLFRVIEDALQKPWQPLTWARRLKPLRGIMRALGGGLGQST